MSGKANSKTLYAPRLEAGANYAAQAVSAADVTGQKIKMKMSRRVSRVVTSAEESG